MASIRVLSGHGRYTDPWHPFAEGSAAIREILEAVGHRVEVRDDDVSCLQELDALDLVVVNLGGNVEVELEHDDEWAAAQHEFGQWIRGGGRVLAVHTAANSFPDWPEWPALLGGQWVRGTSWHPKRCIATFGKAPGAEDYPVWTGLDVVTVYDERYSDLVVHEGSTPLIRHELSEEWQVMGWAHGDNVIYDGMGHDARSYSSPSHRKFLINEVDWLRS
ncbi:ThuA domain-containing protein [Cutibacterium acnes]|uniref:ThuA domain-containing protein n=1 Tax=Cutibacterium acnes TaxID=1747 RepID=UPI0001F08CD4|nr:ThuA domain-containing protein [Cutibacterium acnes]EFT66097.1 hypothetical protein HMPREF9582_00135 [Cutibacterium acnes HL060PA1]